MVPMPEAPGPAAEAGFHALDVEAAVRVLQTDRDHGLSVSEASARLVARGPNVIGGVEGEGPLRLLLEQLSDPLVILLLIAAGISGFVLDEITDAAVILAIVVLNAILGFVQQYRAERALSRLREMAAPTAAVVRAGRMLQIAAAELVPGDLISVRSGDRIPADARVAEAHHLATAEAILTGEAFPESKTAHAVAAEAGLADRTNMVFMGTTVVTGRGMALVTATGRATAMGGIAGLLTQKRPPTPLQRELARLGRLLGVVALVVVAVLFGVGWLEGYSAQEMFLTSVALAVAAVPEGLPAVVTITLARGVQRLASQAAIVRRLQAVETLGAATVVCTDKTGTLTRNRIGVHEVVLDGGMRGGTEQLDVADARVQRYAQVAALCNDSAPGVAGGDPIESALLGSLDRLGLDVNRMRGEQPRMDEAAFDSRRKLMSTLHEAAEGEWFLAAKGAAEVVLSLSTSIESPAGPRALPEKDRERWRAEAAELSAHGFRTLGFGYRILHARPASVAHAERELTFAGLAALSDQTRPEAALAVREAQQAGIRVVMITGDHPQTAAAIATELGILGAGQEVLPGDRLAKLTAEQLSGEVERFGAYARVDPVDKVKIVKAWQEHGETVAMTGDGVNDAPALRGADIGVAMGSGSDVSKDAAAIVLADDNFATLVGAIREGRGIFDNLQKVIRFLLTTNASELLVMTVGFIAFGSLGEPLLATQILWINLVTDGLPVLALAADTPSRDVMRRPPLRSRSLIGSRSGVGVLWRAAILAAATIGVMVYAEYVDGAAWSRVQTTVFTTLVLVQLAYAFLIRAEDRSRPLRGIGYLVVATIASFFLQLAVVYVPAGQRLFSVVPLRAQDWAVVVIATAAAMIVVGLAHRLRLAVGRI